MDRVTHPPLAADSETEDDKRVLHSMGYAQELLRGMRTFQNFAISFSIICILSGGINSFSQGLGSVGGAAAGVVWPIACLISLVFALAMGQIGSAYPTAGGLYHWASILGGRGLGWVTAWFNLIGLVTVLAAINVGGYLYTASARWRRRSASTPRRWRRPRRPPTASRCRPWWSRPSP